MTIPYNAAPITIKKSILDSLVPASQDFVAEGTYYLYANDKDMDVKISNHDVDYIATYIQKLIAKKSNKIARLKEYLKKVATLFTYLNLPII